MPVVSASTVIRASVPACFEAIAEPEMWPRFNPYCKGVEIISREGNATVFIFRHADGGEWCSVQMASREAGVAFVRRLDPEAPIRCFQYVRSVRPVPEGGCVLFEEVRVEGALSDPSFDADASERIGGHMRVLHQHIRQFLESHANGV